jgi:hypothetical protein
MKTEIHARTPVPLSKEASVASSPALALIWRTTMSVAPYFWTVIAILLLSGWFMIDRMEFHVIFLTVVFGASVIGSQCASESLAKGMEYNATLAPTARRRYLVQSIPGLVTTLTLAFAALATTYFAAPKGFLQLLGASLHSPVLGPFDIKGTTSFWLLGLIVGPLLAFSCSYSYTALHAVDTISTRLSKLIGFGYTLAYGAIFLCLVGMILNVSPPTDMGQFTRYTGAHHIVIILLALTALSHYFWGWWAIARSDKIQRGASFLDRSSWRIWAWPLLVTIGFGLSMVLSNSGESENLMQSIDFGKKMNHFQELVAYRENLAQHKMLIGNDAELNIQPPKPGNYFFGARGWQAYRPIATITFFAVLAVLAFLQYRRAPVQPVLKRQWRVFLLIIAIALSGWVFGLKIAPKKEKAQLFEKAMNTMVAYRETPLEPKNSDLEIPPIDINDLEVSLNMVFIDQGSYAPVYATSIPLERKQGDDKAHATFFSSQSVFDSENKNMKMAEGFIITPQDQFQLGPWERSSVTKKWELIESRSKSDFTLHFKDQKYSNTFKLNLPKDFAKPDCPIVGITSIRRSLREVYWFSVSHKDTPTKMRPLREVMEKNVPWLPSEISKRGVVNYGIYRKGYPIEGSSGMMLCLACLLTVFAYKGRLRPDGNLVVLMLIVLSVTVWCQHMTVNHSLHLLKEETVPTAERLASAYHLSRSPLYYPQIAESLSDFQENNSLQVKEAINNLSHQIKLKSDDTQLDINWNHLSRNSHRKTVELLNWIDASEKRCVLPADLGYGILGQNYLTQNSRVIIYAEHPIPHQVNIKVDTLAFNSRGHIPFPDFAHWKRVELAYTPQKLELINTIKEKSVSGFDPEFTEQLSRDATRITFTVKNEYLNELNAVADQEYILLLTKQDYVFLQNGNAPQGWDETATVQASYMIKQWSYWSIHFRDSCFNQDDSSYLSSLENETNQLMHLMMKQATPLK